MSDHFTPLRTSSLYTVMINGIVSSTYMIWKPRRGRRGCLKGIGVRDPRDPSINAAKTTEVIGASISPSPLDINALAQKTERSKNLRTLTRNRVRLIKPNCSGIYFDLMRLIPAIIYNIYSSIGKRWSFGEFLSNALADSNQLKSLVNDLAYDVKEYQGTLRRTKEFQC